MRPLDYVALVISIAAVVGVTVLAYGSPSEASEVSIESDSGTYIYPLDIDRTVEVSGPIGVTVVEISGDQARVADSPCRDKICIAAGWLHASGQWSACLPNRVFVRLEGAEDEDGLDAQTF